MERPAFAELWPRRNALTAGLTTAEASPERTCIVTRAKGDAGGHDSFRDRDRTRSWCPTFARKLPGRGVWVTARADRVAEAVKRQAFSRGFKTKAVASESFGGGDRGSVDKGLSAGLVDGQQSRPRRHGLFQGRRGDCHSEPLRACSCGRLRRRWRSASSGKAYAGAMVMSQPFHALICFRPANWIWHWDGQM